MVVSEAGLVQLDTALLAELLKGFAGRSFAPQELQVSGCGAGTPGLLSHARRRA